MTDDDFIAFAERLDREYVTRRELHAVIQHFNERISQMSTQADLDAVVAQLSQVETDLQASTSTLQAELDALAQANPSLDLTALQAAVSPLDAQVQALGALKPQVAAPAPADPNAPPTA